MMHPTLIENLGRIRKKVDRSHDYGKYQCPFCPNTFVARITEVINEHTTSCGCRKKKNFVEHSLRTIKSLTTARQRQEFLADHRQGRTTKAFSCSKYKVPPKLYGHFLLLAEEEYLTAKPVHTFKADAPTASPSALQLPVAQSIHQTIIVQGDLHMTTTRKDGLLDIPYEQTEAGFGAMQSYYRQFQQMPPDDFDLKAWASQSAAN